MPQVPADLRGMSDTWCRRGPNPQPTADTYGGLVAQLNACPVASSESLIALSYPTSLVSFDLEQFQSLKDLDAFEDYRSVIPELFLDFVLCLDSGYAS